MGPVDYQQLCREYFGTDDVQELKKIAEQVNCKNARNAGRKRKLTQKDIKEIRRLQEEGMTIEKIAHRYGTSRQVIQKYLSKPLADGYTMRMTLMFQHRPCTMIDVNFLEQKIRIQNRTSDILHRAFGTNEQPTWRDFEMFLQERCFPPTRGFLKDELKSMGLDHYDPLQIIEKTKGRTTEDSLWLKIQYAQRTEVQ